MEQVTQTALTGFRSPTEKEIERISQYVKKELSRQRRIQGFWMFFLRSHCLQYAAAALSSMESNGNSGNHRKFTHRHSHSFGSDRHRKKLQAKKAVDPANMRRCLSGAGLLDLRNPVRKRPARSGLGEDLQ